MGFLEDQRAADQVAGIYQDLEEILMINIIRRCRDYGQSMDSEEWQRKRTAETRKLNEENRRLIAESGRTARETLGEMIRDSVGKKAGELEQGFRKLEEEGLVKKAVGLRESEGIRQAVSALWQQAKDKLNLCNTTMLQKAGRAYERLVGDIRTVSEEIEGRKGFQETLNRYGAGMTAGILSRTQAMKECIRRFNDKGISGFVDQGGREWTPEAYVNMAMRNTLKSAADQIQEERCQDYGMDLIEIDAHSGARPKCAKDQGKIYSLSGKSGYTEDGRGRRVRFYSWKDTSYGEPDGILGINCRHHRYPFVPGATVRRYFPTEDLEANDREYQEVQEQRRLEREVRRQKRLCMLYREAGDEESAKEAGQRLSQKEKRLRDYVNSHEGLSRRRDREMVVGWDKGRRMETGS